VIAGYLADRFRKSYIMAVFYLLIGASVFLLANPIRPSVCGPLHSFSGSRWVQTTCSFPW
jgi:hypothetical protein